jgi:hypothetical protein
MSLRDEILSYQYHTVGQPVAPPRCFIDQPPKSDLSLKQLEGMLGLLQDGIRPGPWDMETIADVFCEVIEWRKHHGQT